MKQQMIWLLTGAAAMLLVLLLVGATDYSAPNYGRFQLSTFSADMDDDKAAVGAFVIDTATGETRTVYYRLIDSQGGGSIFKNDLKKPFHSIQ